MIFRWLKRRAAATARERSARDAAQRAFVAAYPERQHFGMVSVFHDDAAGVIVQICYDWGGIPPRRSWWLALEDGSCSELTHDKVNEVRPIPPWR